MPHTGCGDVNLAMLKTPQPSLVVGQDDIVPLVGLCIRLHADQHRLNLFDPAIGGSKFLLGNELGAKQGNCKKCQRGGNLEQRVEVLGQIAHDSNKRDYRIGDVGRGQLARTVGVEGRLNCRRS